MPEQVVVRRDNTDKIDPDEINVIHEWKDDEKLWLNLDTRAKDKMRGAKPVQASGWHLAVDFEQVSWPGDPFANLWVVRREDGEWVCRPIWQIGSKDNPKHIATDQIGKKIYRVLIPMTIDNMPGSGERFGLLIAGDNTDRTRAIVRSSIKKYQMPEWEEPEPEPTPDPGPVDHVDMTINIMGPTLEVSKQYFSNWVSDNWNHFMDECGFEGVHIPFQGRLPHTPAIELLEKCKEEDKVCVIWAFGDIQGGTAPEEIDNQEFDDHMKSLADKLNPFEGNVVLLAGYDWQERNNAREDSEHFVRTWKKYSSIPVGVRYGRRNENDDVPTEFFPGDVKSAEWHMRLNHRGWDNQCREWRQTIGDSAGRWGERGRVRGLYSKDPDWSDVPAMIRSLKKYNLGGDFGFQTRGGPTASVSDWGSGTVYHDYAVELHAAIHGEDDSDDNGGQPDDGNGNEDRLELPDAWGVVGTLDQDHKIKKAVMHTPDIKWVRTQCSPSSGKKVGMDAVVNHWIGRPKEAGFDVIIGPYDRPADIEDMDAFEEWVLTLAQRVEPSWFIVDTETTLTNHMPGGLPQYLAVWHETELIKKLQDLGHKVCGPGNLKAGAEHFKRLINIIRFDAVSAHFYPEKGVDLELEEWWMDTAEDIALSAGYDFGVMGEGGVTGEAFTFIDKILLWLNMFNGEEKQLQRARHFVNLVESKPFWKMKLWYQILDDPFKEVKGSDYGLFTSDWEAKPVSEIFRFSDLTDEN